MYLGVDIGTTGTKSMLVDDDGTILKKEYCGYKIHYDGEGRSEQDAGDWWDAVVRTVKRCARAAPDKSRIKALSLSTQAGTLVLTDSAGNPLARAITWQDVRAVEIGDRLNRQYGQDFFYYKTGWRLGGGYNFLALMWLKEHEPQLVARAEKFLSVNEYVNYKLTGRMAGDYVNAGITQLFNIRECAYDETAMGLLQLPEEKFAELLPPGTVVGTVSAQAAEETGLSTGTKVVIAGQDQYCSSVGLGALEEGDIAMSTGTAWVMLPTTKQPLFDTKSYIAPCHHIPDGLWGNMATLTTGGVSLEWYRQLFGMEKEGFELVNSYAEQTAAGSEGLMFFPYFHGATCPVWQSGAKATFFGLELSHSKKEMARAIMEGVALQMNLILEAIKDIGFRPKMLKMAGGAAKSIVWTQIIADVTGTPVEIQAEPDVACVGAALVAAKADGLFSSYKEGWEAWKSPARLVTPGEQNTCLYRDLFTLYRERVALLGELYPPKKQA